MDTPDTIAAVATPAGKGALAIIRISGKDALSITEKSILEKEKFVSAPMRSVRLYIFLSVPTKKPIDQVSAIKYRAPHSYTGEDMVELICHGGTVVIKEVMASLIAGGARLAGRGEFSRRALCNGKMDLLKAEAIRGIIESGSEAELECGRKLFGITGHIFNKWREDILKILSDLEAEIEFEESNENKGKEKIEYVIDQLNEDIERREKFHAIEKGMKIVITGPANAGKSTLFNFLLGFDRTIVHEKPGTTRDLVGELIKIGNHEVQLIDCAGIRETDDAIEAAGIALTRKAIEECMAIIWVTAADELLKDTEISELQKASENKTLCVVINKTDQPPNRDKWERLEKKQLKIIGVSLLEKKNTDQLLETIEWMVETVMGKFEIPHILFNSRHEEIGKKLLSTMKMASKEWGRPELVAHHLKNGISLFDEFFGKSDPEEIMNKVFEEFCIGK